MKRFIEGENREQSILFPERLDEYIADENPVRVIGAFVSELNLSNRKYWSSACPRCPIKSQCTTGAYRRITRWEHEQVLDDMQRRLEQMPDAMKVRRRTVEHPYATLKAWMGATHFLTRTLPRVSAEMALNVLAYNMKRVMKILGVQRTMEMVGA